MQKPMIKPESTYLKENDDLTLPKVRLRILLSAHECSPAQGSECSVGWNLAVRLGKYHDITLLCASGSQTSTRSYRAAIEAYLRGHGPINGVRIVYVDQTRLSRFLAAVNIALTGVSDGVGNRLLFLLALKSWHRSAAGTARKLGISNFDLVHHLNPIAYWGVGQLWKLPRPFCWGPVGGMFTVPPRIARWLGWRSTLLEMLRKMNRYWASGRVRKIAERASVIWAVSSAEANVIHNASGRAARLMVDTGTASGVVGRIRCYHGDRKLLLCWSGRHWAPKALPILLYALSSSPRTPMVSVLVLGDGPETQAWKKLAFDLGLSGVIRWTGNLPHGEAIAQMGTADILVHTSVREAASSVLMEALPLGMPVVCHDASGMGVVVNDACGFKIPLKGPDESILGFRTAIERFFSDKGLLERMSAGALKRASELTWDAKAAEIASAYRECVSAARIRQGPDGLHPTL